MVASGKKIGHYEIVELIGKGGMGRVFRGRDIRSNSAVAIKVLPQDALEHDPGLLQRLKVEGEALRLLNHPNIVKILDVVEEDHEYSLVLEYIEGGTLADLLRAQGQLPFEKVLKIALGLADALTRAHQLKIIHRDIKPANILLTKDGIPHLTDFGLARMESSNNLTQTGTVIGSVSYLSPESIRKTPPSPRTDIWSFGVVLYEMVAGRSPFAADNIASILTSIVLDPVPDILQFRPHTPPALVGLINQMLDKNPEKRIQSARRVGAELEAMIEMLDSDAGISLGSEIINLVGISRFDTPSPPSTATEREIDPSLLSGVRTLPVIRPSAQSLLAQSNVPRRQSRLWRWTAGVVLVIGLILSVVFALSEFSIEADDTTNETSTVVAIEEIEPVAADELMVLVAQLEPLGKPQPNRDRFILEDLREVIERSAALNPLRIRAYTAPVSSREEALEIARRYQVPLMVWGNYNNEFIEVEILVTHFEEAALPLDLLWDTAGVRLRLQDERTASLAPHILSAATLYYAFIGDTYEAANMMVTYAELRDLPRADIIGVNVGAHVHRHYAALYTDAEAAVESLDAALRIQPRNPILHHLRAAALDRLGNSSEAEQSVNSALLFSDNRWVIPFVNLANIYVSRGDVANAIVQMDSAVTLRPDDWLLYAMRGSFHYLAGNYGEAEADFQSSIARDPKANFPYVLSMNIAIREGRIQDVTALMDEVLLKFPDPTYGNRIILTAGNDPEYGGFYALLLSAFANLAIRQYDAVIRDIEAALEVNDAMAELYLFQGVAHCVNGDFDAAEAAYSLGIELDSDLTILYLLRADIRRRNDNAVGAFQDFQAAQETPAWENFAALVSDPANANLGCESFFE